VLDTLGASDGGHGAAGLPCLAGEDEKYDSGDIKDVLKDWIKREVWDPYPMAVVPAFESTEPRAYTVFHYLIMCSQFRSEQHYLRLYLTRWGARVVYKTASVVKTENHLRSRMLASYWILRPRRR
jgi:hypothetical protein